MNIIDQFGKRKNGLVLDPREQQNAKALTSEQKEALMAQHQAFGIGSMAAPTRQPPANPKLHPEAVAHIDQFTRTAERVAVLEQENQTLAKQLDVALALGEEFKRLHDLAVREARRWEAYAVETRTYAQTIRDAADRLHAHGKAAQERVEKAEPKITPEQAASVAAGIEAELIGQKFGSSTSEGLEGGPKPIA